MNAIYLEETIDMMKECLKRMESIREGEVEKECPQCEGTGIYSNNLYVECICPCTDPKPLSSEWIQKYEKDCYRKAARKSKVKQKEEETLSNEDLETLTNSIAILVEKQIPEPVRITSENFKDYIEKEIWHKPSKNNWYSATLIGLHEGALYHVYNGNMFGGTLTAYATDPTEYLKQQGEL